MSVGLEALKKECSNFAALARELNITRGAIAQWRDIPADRVVEIERVTGIPRQKLRPDLYVGMSTTPKAVGAGQ